MLVLAFSGSSFISGLSPVVLGLIAACTDSISSPADIMVNLQSYPPSVL